MASILEPFTNTVATGFLQPLAQAGSDWLLHDVFGVDTPTSISGEAMDNLDLYGMLGDETTDLFNQRFDFNLGSTSPTLSSYNMGTARDLGLGRMDSYQDWMGSIPQSIAQEAMDQYAAKEDWYNAGMARLGQMNEDWGKQKKAMDQGILATEQKARAGDSFLRQAQDEIAAFDPTANLQPYMDEAATTFKNTSQQIYNMAAKVQDQYVNRMNAYRSATQSALASQQAEIEKYAQANGMSDYETGLMKRMGALSAGAEMIGQMSNLASETQQNYQSSMENFAATGAQLSANYQDQIAKYGVTDATSRAQALELATNLSQARAEYAVNSQIQIENMRNAFGVLQMQGDSAMANMYSVYESNPPMLRTFTDIIAPTLGVLTGFLQQNNSVEQQQFMNSMSSAGFEAGRLDAANNMFMDFYNTKIQADLAREQMDVQKFQSWMGLAGGTAGGVMDFTGSIGAANITETGSFWG